jgi:hypothetical protein
MGLLDISIDATLGNYTVSVGGSAWLESGATWMSAGGHTFSSADGSLRLKGTTTAVGADVGGAFNETSLMWVCSDVAATPFVTAFRTYGATHVVFESRWPLGAEDTSSGVSGGDRQKVLSSFPSFRVRGRAGERGYASMGGSQVWPSICFHARAPLPRAPPPPRSTRA